jgi:hypothetical protein
MCNIPTEFVTPMKLFGFIKVVLNKTYIKTPFNVVCNKAMFYYVFSFSALLEMMSLETSE